MSNPEKLIRTANQIAAFFKPYPRAEAVAAVHGHIWDNWTPNMRADLLALCESKMANIDVLVSEAMLSASAARSPAAKEAAGLQEVGELGSSDAG